MYNYNIEDEFAAGRVIAALSEYPTYLNILQLFESGSAINGIEVSGIEILHYPHGAQGNYSYISKEAKDHYILLIKLKSKEKLAVPEAISILSQDPNILYAEPDYLMQLDIIPNDPYMSTLWGMRNIRAPYAWNTFSGSSGVVVGVVDSGIDYCHNDLISNIWTDQNGDCGWDFFEDYYDPMDINGHGTHVAGTIGATGNNGIGVAGVSWNVKMVAMKITGDSSAISASAAIKAVEYAIDNNIPILNNSWGGRAYCESLKAEIEQYNGLFIASSGNSGLDNDYYPHYPASYDCDNIISVAAAGQNDNLSSFSNYGASTVDISAPGAEIYSSVLNNGYGFMSGTSMAAPHVTGAAALLKGYRPDLSAPEIKHIILSSADKVPALYGSVLTGGKLNVNAMLDMAGVNTN